MVNNLDSLARGICQHPLLASSLLNTVAPDICASVVSTFIGCTSRNTFSLRGLRSTHPNCLGTTTIAAHQGVGSSTGEITPKLFIRCNSHCTFNCSGRRMFHEAFKANSWLFGLSLIVYLHANVPSPVSNKGYCEMIFFPTEHAFSNNSSSLIAGNPRRSLFRSLITHTSVCSVSHGK